MKTTRQNLLPVLATALLVITGSSLFVGCGPTPTTESTGQLVDDSVVTTKVKSALLADESVKSFAISVETLKGVVQLSGFVDNAAQKTAAGAVAAAVPGAREVKNSLIVK